MWIGLLGTHLLRHPLQLFFAVLGFSLCCKSYFTQTTSFLASQMWARQCLRRFTFYDFDRRSQLGLNESQLLTIRILCLCFLLDAIAS